MPSNFCEKPMRVSKRLLFQLDMMTNYTFLEYSKRRKAYLRWNIDEN